MIQRLPTQTRSSSACTALLTAAALVTAAALTACGSTPIDWIVVFANPALETSAERVEGSVRVGGCSGTEVAFVADVSGGMSMSPSELSSGTHGFYARAIDADCNVIAEGCTEQEIPAPSGTVVLTTLTALPAPTSLCDAAECTAGRCGGAVDAGADGGRDDGGRDDGGPDSGELDSGPVDAGEGTCGNGARDPGEICDFSVDVCCNIDCSGALSAGTTCRVASDLCDAEELCDGARFDCPADGLATGTECRPSLGVCDPAETCDGSGPACPADGLATGTECRPSLGVCDPAETCDGSGPACPADGFATGTECRPSLGMCDPAETCDGSGPACPADGFATGTECRPSLGVCDPAETCDGSGPACPADVRSTAVCRPGVGCDATESCNGVSATCPADLLEPAGTVCRPSAGTCDPAETCTGASATCPGDVRTSARVGLYAADSAGNHTNVRTMLVAEGGLASVTIGGPVTSGFTPSLAELMAYDSLFVWGSASWNGNAFGDVLADYIETGRGVVIAVFAQRPGSGVGVEGRFGTAGYRAYVPASHGFSALSMVTPPAMPAHPIMAGVSSFGGPTIGYHDGAHNPAASLIASFNNGRPLVAAFQPTAGRSVLLGIYPTTSFWDSSTDGARLMVNALSWAACGP